MERAKPGMLGRIISLGSEMLSKAFNGFDPSSELPGLMAGQQTVQRRLGNNRHAPRYRQMQSKGFRDHNLAGSKPTGRMLARHG